MGVGIHNRPVAEDDLEVLDIVGGESADAGVEGVAASGGEAADSDDIGTATDGDDTVRGQGLVDGTPC